jgi:hypothetical protein
MAILERFYINKAISEYEKKISVHGEQAYSVKNINIFKEYAKRIFAVSGDN